MVYNWFVVLKERYNADVVAYVIMPNLVHVIVHFRKEGFNLNTIIANGKDLWLMRSLTDWRLQKTTYY